MKDLNINKLYVLESKNSKPTKFSSYIIECSDNETDETFLLFMPEYIIDNGKVGQKFVYTGMKDKANNSGHEYHYVLWKQK